MTLIGRTRARGVETLGLDSPGNRNALSVALVAPVLDGPRAAAPGALAETKRLVTARVLETLDRDAAGLTALSARLFAAAEAREGKAAFLERRDPAWVV